MRVVGRYSEAVDGRNPNGVAEQMSVSADNRNQQPGRPLEAEGLHRELRLIDAAAFSIGLVGPVGAMALLGVGAAGILGRAAPLAFIFALVGVALVAYGFIRLSQHISHAGSVYGLVGLTVGPRAGFFAGWSLFFAYMTIGAGSAIEIGLFGSEFLRGVGIVDTTEWIVIAGCALLLAAGLAFARVHVITRSLLTIEIIGVALITLLCVVIIIRLAIGEPPSGQRLNVEFLKLPSGTDLSTIATASVFGFLAFAGFEGAATLGEETTNPRRDIPRAIIIAIVVIGVFYLLAIVGQTLGYGTSGSGVEAFQGAVSPYGDLGKAYVGAVLRDVLNLIAALSLFALLLATVAAAARIMFALARDAGGTRGVARLSGTGAPVVALTLVLLVDAGIMIGQRLAGSSVLDATFYALTIGTLALLVAYLMATVGAIKFLFLGRERRAPAWQIVIPLAAIAFVGYTLYKNLFNLDAPYDRFPIIVGAWLLIGLAVVLFVPGIAERVRRGLAESGAHPSGEEPARP
jgi:amino acid transporter